ncbi:MAG: nickel pincer cofactor biosynthesis protein LarC [Planctomycetota bacterium]|jgi:uncharacterized protein (TIGR00299 family) protein
MRILLVEPFAGIAGDMFVGALVHAGAPFARVEAGLQALEAGVSCEPVLRCGLAAKKFRVRHEEGHHHRGLKAILDWIGNAPLTDRAKELAGRAFRRLAEAEAAIHGVGVDEVHFHEVGAVDAICDIVGASICLDALDVTALYCRPLPLSTGTVQAAHGRLPVPAPATLELLKGRRTFDSGLEGELITPTGAAVVAAWTGAGDPPAFVPTAIGYGAGDRDPEGYPNVCRVTLGDAEEKSEPSAAHLCELVCDVDDATPQVLGHLLGRLLEAGALDATLQPVVMKKNRPGTRVSALVRAECIPAVEQVLFREGTTLGVRRRAVTRTELPRRIVEVATEHGTVRLKVGELGGEVVHVAPEYEDCRALAEAAGVPLREIIRQAMAQWRR